MSNICACGSAAKYIFMVKKLYEQPTYYYVCTFHLESTLDGLFEDAGIPHLNLIVYRI